MKFTAGVIYTIEFEATDKDHAKQTILAYNNFLVKWNDAMGLTTGGLVESSPIPKEPFFKSPLVGDVVKGRRTIEPYITYSNDGDVDSVLCADCVQELNVPAVKVTGVTTDTLMRCDACARNFLSV